MTIQNKYIIHKLNYSYNGSNKITLRVKLNCLCSSQIAVKSNRGFGFAQDCNRRDVTSNRAFWKWTSVNLRRNFCRVVSSYFMAMVWYFIFLCASRVVNGVLINMPTCRLFTPTVKLIRQILSTTWLKDKSLYKIYLHERPSTPRFVEKTSLFLLFWIIQSEIKSTSIILGAQNLDVISHLKI